MNCEVPYIKVCRAFPKKNVNSCSGISLHAKNQSPRKSPSGRKVKTEKIKEREITVLIVDTAFSNE